MNAKLGERFYELTRDVAAEAYSRFITEILKTQDTFTLVWHERPSPRDYIRSALRTLQVKHDRTDRWPGTRIVGPNARADVIRFRCDNLAEPILLRPGSLFGWQRPEFPEDLAFWDTRGRPVVVTVSHEKMGWVLDKKVASWFGKLTMLETVDRLSADELDNIRGV